MFNNPGNNTLTQNQAIASLEIGEYGSAANHYFTALYEAALAQEVDVNMLLQGVGLSRSFVNQPDIRIPTEKLAEFQKTIWDWMNDESMGVNSQPIPSGTYFMMGKLTINQPNLKKVIQLAIRFYNLMLQRDFVTLEIQGDEAILRIHLEDLEKDHKHLFAEICLLSWHRYASWIIADVLPLSEVRFFYPPHKYVNEYNYLFPGVHKFSSSDLALVFPCHYLDKENKQNESSLKVFMNRCPLELFKQYQTDYNLSTEIKIYIKKWLDTEFATIECSADKMHMTSRTLMRKLKEEGTSFQQIKDLVRHERAIHLLSQKGISISEVSERVGYSDPAVFTRAFRKWTGESPKGFRNKFMREDEGNI